MPQSIQTRKTSILKHPVLDVRADFLPDSVDVESRTAVFVASAGAKGLRRTWPDGDYYEQLEISTEAIRLDRYNSGAPLIKDHNAYTIDNQIGVIERAWIENNLLMSQVRFASDEASDVIFKKVADGILRNVSVGYRVHTYRVLKQEGELDLYTATDWEPFELSLVAIPFDPAAQIRSNEETFNANIIFETREGGNINEGNNMNLEQRAAAMGLTRSDGETDIELMARVVAAETRSSIAKDQTKVDDGQIEKAVNTAILAEQKRSADIYKAVSAAKLGDDFARDMVLENISVDESVRRINQKLIERQDATPSQSSRVIIQTGDHVRSAEMVRDASDAILHRFDTGIVGGKLSDGARNYRGLTLVELSRSLLQSQGIDTMGMSHQEIAKRAITSGDLANITADVANKTLRAGYESGIRTFVGVFRQASASDFKNINRVQLSGAPSLEKVNEDGEYRYGTVSDGKESYALATYGKILPFTRQAIINDDLGALTRIPQMFGRAAADLESDIVWGIVTANAALSDGITLFHASHNNDSGSAGAINATNVGAARKAMREQTGLDGRLINVMPKWIVAGASKETELEKFLSPGLYAAVSDNIIPTSMRSLMPVIEPRLTGNDWFVFGDYNQIDTIEYAYLEGEEGVYIETQAGFDIDGIKIKARHDFAAKAIDYRGAFRNGA